MASKKQPWHHNVTVSIPHRDTIDALEACIACLRWQSEPPMIHVIDTGSRPEVCELLGKMRADDLQVHFLDRGAWRDPHQCIAAAIDVSMALTQTERHYTTHVDVFLKARDWIERLTKQCDAKHPVVGYEMSERSWITDQWRGMVGHTSTMLFMPTMRTIGAMWCLEWAYRMLGKKVGEANGWPDTETGFNTMLRRACVIPYLVGHETNDMLYEDEDLIHLRSYTYRKYMIWGQGADKDKYLAMADQVIRRALSWTRGTPKP